MAAKKKTVKKKASRKKLAKRRVVKKKASKKTPWKATPKQQRFIEEYPIDFNATKAAQRAGYSMKTAYSQGHDLLKKPEIQVAIQKLVGKLSLTAGITAERVLAEIAKVGFANLGDYFRISEQGEPYIDLSDLTNDQMAALQEITVEDFTDGRGDNSRDVRRIKIKMLDKLNALDKLGKNLALFVERHRIEGELKITKIVRTIVDPKSSKKTKKKKKRARKRR